MPEAQLSSQEKLSDARRALVHDRQVPKTKCHPAVPHPVLQTARWIRSHQHRLLF